MNNQRIFTPLNYQVAPPSFEEVYDVVFMTEEAYRLRNEARVILRAEGLSRRARWAYLKYRHKWAKRCKAERQCWAQLEALGVKK